ncbi:MAG: TolC family protein, partial [Nitrospirae bacterium]|nr:TolC family protein [Nitrospirota bacterium]
IVTSRSRDVKISLAEEEASKENIPMARSAWLPRIDLYSYHTTLRYDPEATFGPFGPVQISERSFLTYGFKVQQLIYDFGRTSSLIEGARYGLKASALQTKRVRNLIALEFIDAYFDLLKSKSLLDVSSKEVERLESHLKDTTAMYEEGLITKNDLLQAEVMLADARQKRIDAENLYKLRQSRLNMLLLRDLNKPVEAEDTQWHPFTEYNLEDAWRNAIQQRPEIKAIDAEIALKQSEIKSTEAEYLPTLFVSGGYEYQENRFMVHEGNWSVVGGINLNLSSGGLTRSSIKQKRAQLKALEIKKEKLIDSIRLEVKEAFLRLHSTQNRVRVTKKAVEQAEENLRLQRLRYKEGVGTATEVTDAVTLLTRAETNYLSALYESFKAEARLLYTMGFDLTAAYNPMGTSEKEAYNGKGRE